MAKILIADDNMDGLFCAKTILQVMGNEVMVAYNGLAAYTMTNDLEPDIVILDYKMPQIDGRQAAEHIREAKGADCPLIVELTGLPDAESDVFDSCLEKPLNFKELYETCLAAGFDINPAKADLALLK